MKKIEAALQRVIFPELEKGRPGWDLPHTKAVVAWVKWIIAASPKLKLDKVVLVVAAYGHDWGYSGLFQQGKRLAYGEMMETKALHMKLGAEKIRELLKDPVFDELQKAQKERVVHLVAVHDKLRSLEDLDELVLMEADTLGALDTDMAAPTLNAAENKRYIQGVMRTRRPRFVSEAGKKEFERLIEKRRKVGK